MILNKRFPQVLQGNIRYNTKSRYFEIFDFNGTELYWYIEVGDIHSLTLSIIDEVIPHTILTSIINGSTTLVIVNAFEGMHNVLELVYENLILKRNVPEESIIFFSESFSIHNSLAEYVSRYNKNPIRILNPLISEYTTALHMQDSPLHGQTVQSKRYLCLNRRWRPHRPTLVGLLKAKNILEHGYVSLIETESETWDRTFDWIVSLNSSNTEVQELLENNRHEIMKLSNLKVDLDDLTDYGNIWGFREYTEPFYNSTYFSVVTETYFYDHENGICITEKVFRPMCYKHPFIVLARPKLLETIRSLGYQTFNGIIDESYDMEENDATRMLMVANEIEKLCKMPIEELEHKILQCKSICEHNYKVLLSGLTKPKRKLDNN